MLEQATQHVLRDALQLPEEQRAVLIDALLAAPSQEAEQVYSGQPPLSEERLRELAKEGRDALNGGRRKDFDSPRELADHVGNIFSAARHRSQG